MGGIDWTAIPYVVERFGIDDVDAFVSQLIAIREHLGNRERASAKQ
jgi:hypothetical protein